MIEITARDLMKAQTQIQRKHKGRYATNDKVPPPWTAKEAFHRKPYYMCGNGKN